MTLLMEFFRDSKLVTKQGGTHAIIHRLSLSYVMRITPYPEETARQSSTVINFISVVLHSVTRRGHNDFSVAQILL
jgi:hypothetical protein